MRSISMNRLYSLKIIASAFVIIWGSLILMPQASQATPRAVSALEAGRGEQWRAYYRDKFFVDIYRDDLLDSLKGFRTDDPLIKEAIRQCLAGRWELSIEMLTGISSKAKTAKQREIAYIQGLIYESVALFHEALVYYESVSFEGKEPRGSLYYKTLLRKSYVKFLSDFKAPTPLGVSEAEKGFRRVFEESATEGDWLAALSAHGVTLFYLGAHDEAELIFQSVLDYRGLKPAALFVHAENYMNLRRYGDAQTAFSELLLILKNSSQGELRSYIYLRLGDIANFRGERDEALTHYKLITPALLSSEVRGINASHIIRSMAMAESFIKSEKNNEALELFNAILSGPMPIGLDLREIISLNMVLLYAIEDLELQAFNRAKEFILLYPDNPHIDEVKRITDDQVYKSIVSAKRKQNHDSLLQYYYINKRFIDKKLTLLLVGDLLLRRGFPLEANKIFSSLWKRRSNYRDIELLTGLAMSEAMLGRMSEAAELLSRAVPKNSSERVEIIDKWIVIGDLYYRKGDNRNALNAYVEVRKGLYDAFVELKYAALLTKFNRNREAINVYRSLLRRVPSSDIKGLTYQGVAKSYAALGNLERALKNYELALKVANKDEAGKIHYMIGEINYALGRGSEAASAWENTVLKDVDGYYRKLAALRIEEQVIWEEARL